jgi:hypothetical protein
MNADNRHRLPNRREHEVIDFEFRGHRYSAGLGRFADGRPAEIFLDCSKVASPLAADARDVAVAISIALQFGAPISALRAAVSREADDTPAGIAGAVLDLLEAK